ncbi:MAG: hypothetical protein OXH00_00535 [Candidatus Poribacteria bacterium]|nr:hypothetical protein [Candidatus Poribacteria bacterium]
MIIELKGIVQPKNTDTVWRYMSFEKFADILATGCLFFSSADKYNDKFEGYIPELIMRYYTATRARSVPELRQYIMCNCWHHGDEESMAMWDKYHLRNNGIAIKTTMENLKNSLPDEPNIFIGKVDYDVNPLRIETKLRCLKIQRISYITPTSTKENLLIMNRKYVRSLILN